MQPASTLQVASATQSVSMMQVTSTSQTTSVLQMSQTVQMVSTAGAALGSQGTFFWPAIGATSIGVPGSYYPSAEGRPLGGFLGFGAGVTSSLPPISPSAWTCPQINSSTFNQPSQASNVIRPLLAPNSSPLNPPPASPTPQHNAATPQPINAHPVVASCRVSFSSRAVGQGVQNSSLVTSTPASPSSASSPASSSPSTPSSASSRASSAMGMSPSHGLQSPVSIICPSNFQPLSPATSQTPAAPLLPSIRGLLQPATPATNQQSSQSQSTAVGAPHTSKVLMRSASSKKRTLSQASQSHSHPFWSMGASPITVGDSSDDSNGAAHTSKVKKKNKEIVSIYLLLIR